MSLVAVVLIAVVINIIVLGTCGAGGGLMLLVAHNGFSESAAMPFLIGYGLITLIVSFAISTGASWLYAKKRSAESGIRFGYVAGINAGVIVVIILIVVAVMAIRSF